MEVSLQLNTNTLRNVKYYVPKAMQSGSRGKGSVKISCRVKEMRANFYQLLSLNSEDNVGLDEIKKAYRSKALEFHPDVCPPSNRDESSRRFVEIRQAYDTLSDPDSRRRYDYEMSLADEDTRGEYSKKVWERQLSGLKRRSLDKLEKKRNASA